MQIPFKTRTQHSQCIICALTAYHFKLIVAHVVNLPGSTSSYNTICFSLHHIKIHIFPMCINIYIKFVFTKKNWMVKKNLWSFTKSHNSNVHQNPSWFDLQVTVAFIYINIYEEWMCMCVWVRVDVSMWTCACKIKCMSIYILRVSKHVWWFGFSLAFVVLIGNLVRLLVLHEP